MAYFIHPHAGPPYGGTQLQLVNGDGLKAYLAKAKSWSDSISSGGWMGGARIPPEVVPLGARLLKGKGLKDYLHTYLGGGIVVSQAFRDCVEELDPGRHQFFPLEVVDKPGEPVPGPFFMFNVVGQIEAIIEARSNLRPSGRGQIASWGYERKVGPWTCALNKAVIGDRACWTDLRYRLRWFVSDRLADSLRKRKLKGLRLDDCCEEVTV